MACEGRSKATDTPKPAWKNWDVSAEFGLVVPCLWKRWEGCGVGFGWEGGPPCPIAGCLGSLGTSTQSAKHTRLVTQNAWMGCCQTSLTLRAAANVVDMVFKRCQHEHTFANVKFMITRGSRKRSNSCVGVRFFLRVSPANHKTSQRQGRVLSRAGEEIGLSGVRVQGCYWVSFIEWASGRA